MSQNCPSCGFPLEYDPHNKTLYCSICGNLYDPKEKEEESSVPAPEPVPMREVKPLEELLPAEKFDCNVYTCSQCGGEVIVTDTEVSTRCMFCGSTSVVFSRIEKTNRPDFIIPFKVTKEEAIQRFHHSVGKGFFVPKEFKKIDPEFVRGIYLPADIYSGDFGGAQQRDGSDKEKITRVGKCRIESLPVFSCSTMPQTMSLMLDPYYFSQAEEFNTSYLMGFYADSSDVSSEDSLVMAELKASKMFEAKLWDEDLDVVQYNVFGDTPSALKSSDNLEKVGSAMLPVWFIPVRYQGRPHTFLVNGQTGKVVGTAPWNRKRFWGLYVLSCILIACVFFATFAALFSEPVESESSDDFFYALCLLIGAGCAVVRARKSVIDFNEHASHTLRSDTYVFAKKRQGDNN